MASTQNLQLPLIAAAQAQKHVTHNEALTSLDALFFLAVASRSQSAPPSAPAPGERYLIAGPASGAWTGSEGNLAVFIDGGWRYFTPLAGWIARIQDEHRTLSFDGANWVNLVDAGGLTELQNLALLGVGATADGENPLAVKGPNILLASLDPAYGGSGDVRLKLSKSAGANIASLLLQNNYSARAELGLIAGDDLVLQLSADGSNWVEALRASASGGHVSIANATADAHALNRITADGRYLSAAAQTLSSSQLSQILANIGDAFAVPDGAGVNYSLSPIVGANALTLSVRTRMGNTPSPADPVKLAFRNPSWASGQWSVRTIAAALSLTIPSGATLGHASNLIGSLYWYAVDNGGTVELAVAGSFLGNDGIISTTVLSTSSSSSSTMYSAAARTGVPFILLGRTADTQTAAGTWASAPSHVQAVRQLETIRNAGYAESTASALLTAGIGFSDAMPQNTAGTQILTLSVTLSWPANRVRVTSRGYGGQNGSFGLIACIFSSLSSNALDANWFVTNGSGYRSTFSCQAEHAPSTSAAITYSLRVGPAGAGSGAVLNGTYNGTSISRDFGGASRTTLVVEEITA